MTARGWLAIARLWRALGDTEMEQLALREAAASAGYGRD